MAHPRNPDLVYPHRNITLQCETGTRVLTGRELHRAGAGWPRPSTDLAPSDTPLRNINALTLGGQPLDLDGLMRRSIALARITGLTGTRIESWGSSVGGVNRTAFEMTAAATPAEYDLIVIDNAGSHYPEEYARVIGKAMLSQTLLRLTQGPYRTPMTPESARDTCARWEDEFGIAHFSGHVLGTPEADVIAEMLEDVPVVVRPVEPDIEIVTKYGYGGASDQ